MFNDDHSSSLLIGNTNDNNISRSDHEMSSASNHETFLKLDIESLLTDLHQDEHQQQQLNNQQQLSETNITPSSHNSKNGSLIDHKAPHQNFIENSFITCGGGNGSRILDETFEEYKNAEDSDNNFLRIENVKKKEQVVVHNTSALIVSNSLSSATVQQQPIRTVSNNFTQPPKLFTIVQYDPQQNNSTSSPLTYHHISPSNQFPTISNNSSDKQRGKSPSTDVHGKSKRERTFKLPSPVETQFVQTNFHPSTSTFQWSENEFQEFTSGQHETQKRQRKERVYRFYESGPTSFSNSEDPQSATSLVSNNSVFDSNSPNSPPLKKTKRKKKEPSASSSNQ